MEIYQTLILGIVQGITELLPISSSAHLKIIPWMFDWIKQPGFNEAFKGFDVALHFGTLLAILIVFYKDWIKLIKGGFNITFKKQKSKEGKMFWYLVAATIPGGIIGFLLDHFCEDALNKPIIISIALIIMGIVLYYADKKSKSEIEYKEMNFKQTFLIGLSQALAFIPGVSRSGITMTTARLMGITRKAAAKFSFLLSTPIVFGATILKFKYFTFDLPFIIGVLASLIVGLIVIKVLFKYLNKGDFKIFAIYRVIFGIIIIFKILIG